VAEVEHHLALAGDRRDDAGLAAHRPDGRHAAVPQADLADLEGRGRRGGQRVAAQPHRRRPGVGGLPVEVHQVPLVADRAADG
jgi:hypothetical protein